MRKSMFICIYLLILNFITFIVFGLDKLKAKKHKWRIKASTLLGLCFLGGSLGGLIGMYTFRHKTKQKYFTIGVPLMLITQVVLIIYLYTKLI